jgi:DNA-binding MarR family transcriptional regulator
MTETRDEAVRVMISLRRIVRLLRLADRQIEAAAHLSAAQLFVLHTLVDTSPLSLAEVAARSLTDPSSVSTVVSRLVERGLVARRISPADRRRAELRITPAGRRVIASAPTLPQPRIIAAIRAMPAGHRADLVSTLEAFATAIGAAGVAPRMFFEDEPDHSTTAARGRSRTRSKRRR